MNFMIRGIDDEIWDKFKIICIMERRATEGHKLTLNDKMKKLIEEEVKVKAKKFSGKG